MATCKIVTDMTDGSLIIGTYYGYMMNRVVLTWSKPDEYYSLSDRKGTWEKEGGGVIIDQAIHSLDLANWFINDKIESVQAQLSNRGHSIMEVDDSAEGFVRYKNGKDYWGFQHIRQIADFYKSIENNEEPFISGREALKIQKLICEIYEKGNFVKVN